MPEDANVTAAKKRLVRAQQPVPLDSVLASLRVDAEQSELQMKNPRLTAAEDLVWALINSPEFLFNH